MSSATSFVEMEYQRVPLEDMKTQYEGLQRRLPSADARGIVEIVREWTQLRSRYQTMSQLNQVRYTIDTRDDSIKQERKYLDDQEPTVEDWNTTCLLYTSDAADERSSVDLGGRRIIKKKK